jgi:membrane protein
MEQPHPPARGATREIVDHLRTFRRLGRREIIQLFREALNNSVADKVPRLGASLAYYTLLSLAPLLVVAVAIAALVLGKTAVEGRLFWQTQGLLGKDGAAALQGLVRNANQPGTGIFATVIGIVTLLFGASSAVIELTDALNTIWHVAPDSSSTGWGGLVTLLKERFYAFAIILGTGILLLVSLLANTALSAINNFFAWLLPVPAPVLHGTEFVFAFCVTTVLFAAIYKFLPTVDLRWSDVFIGACVTSLLFTVGKQLISIYLGKESFGSTYGAAGSLVALLVWIYYSAQLFFLGAEFTKVYSRKLGSQRTAT